MAITDEDIARAEKAMRDTMAAGPRATAARYDRRRSRVVVSLDNGLELAFPPRLTEGLGTGTPDDLTMIEISATGMGLHWPKLDADLYLPALMSGIFGSPRWMAGQMGRKGGSARSDVKSAAGSHEWSAWGATEKGGWGVKIGRPKISRPPTS
jgi:hypothetical protein